MRRKNDWEDTWVRLGNRRVPLQRAVDEDQRSIDIGPIEHGRRRTPIDWIGIIGGILIFIALSFVTMCPGCSTGQTPAPKVDHDDLIAACQHCWYDDLSGHTIWTCGETLAILEENGGCRLKEGSTR